MAVVHKFYIHGIVVIAIWFSGVMSASKSKEVSYLLSRAYFKTQWLRYRQDGTVEKKLQYRQDGTATSRLQYRKWLQPTNI